MIIDLIDKLVDRCIQLVRHREEVSRQLFENFIGPIHADFETIHQSYLDSFREYRRMLKTSIASFTESHPVLDAIYEDAKFNSKLRMRIHSMALCEDDPLLGKFISSIYKYFHRLDFTTHHLFLDELDEEGPAYIEEPPDNVPRNYARDKIGEIFESQQTAAEKQLNAIHVIDEIVEELQSRYSAETREFFELKKKLITLK
jgi:hypothetical protein